MQRKIKTSVSERIRKTLLTETKTAFIWKPKKCSVERQYLSYFQILWKTASSLEISLKSGNQLLSYGQKHAPSTILNFKNFHIWSCDCHRVPNLYIGIKFNQNRTIYAARCYASATYVIMQCQCVCVSVTFVNSVKTINIVLKFFHYRAATPF